MRALQIDPKHYSPQRWAQMSFYGCTASMGVQALLVIIMPLCAEFVYKKGLSEDDVVVVMENQTLAAAITAIRYLALLALYGGFTAVTCSIFFILTLNKGMQGQLHADERVHYCETACIGSTSIARSDNSVVLYSTNAAYAKIAEKAKSGPKEKPKTRLNSTANQIR